MMRLRWADRVTACTGTVARLDGRPPEHVIGRLPPVAEVYVIGSAAWGWRVASEEGHRATRAQAKASARRALARWCDHIGGV